MVDKSDEKQCKECEYGNWGRKDWKNWKRHSCHHKGGGCGGAIYGLGVIGALVYFIGQATTFWAGLLGILQAFFWPAFLVYEALKALIK